MKRNLHYMLLVIVFMIIAVLFIPVKFAVNTDDISGKCFICKDTATTGPNWLIIGDENGMYDYPINVFIEGADPMRALKNSFFVTGINTYIVYGELVGTKRILYGSDEYFPILQSTGFDIVYPIDRGDSFRFFVPKKYLTVFDYAKIWRIN